MLDKEGFLSSDILKYRKEIESKYYELFNYYKEINVFGQTTILRISVDSNLVYQWSLAALFIRSLSTFQSIYLLAQNGIIAEGRILSRTLIEIQYIVIAIEKDNELGKVYNKQVVLQTKKLFEKAKKWSDSLENRVDVNDLSEKIDDLKGLIVNHEIKEFNTKKWAESAGMLEDYEKSYQLFCYASHASMADLKDHLVLNGEHLLENFKCGPDIKRVPEVLLGAANIMLKIIESIGKSFKIDIESRVKQTKEKFLGLTHFYHENVK